MQDQIVSLTAWSPEHRSDKETVWLCWALAMSGRLLGRPHNHTMSEPLVVVAHESVAFRHSLFVENHVIEHASLEEINIAYERMPTEDRQLLLEELLSAFPHGWEAVAFVVDCFVMGDQAATMEEMGGQGEKEET